jgi:hypothetical protein
MPLQTQGKRRTVAQDVPVKRFRVSRACDQCRAERSKCDGNQPQCAPCFDNNRECTFTSNPKKRGLPPGYIRGIELALALVCQQSPEIEASLIAKLGHENSVLLARDTKDSNRLHKCWRKSKVCKELNKRLTGEQSGAENEEPMSSGEDSDAGIERDTSIAPVIPGSLRQTPIQQHHFAPSLPFPPGGQSTMDNETLTPLPSDCWQLLESYSTYTQCWLPISEKLDILKLSYSYPSQGLWLSPTMPDSGHHAEMWSMLTLSSSQDIVKRYSGRQDGRSMHSGQMYKTTQHLIPTEVGNFQLGHAKALLNLALVNLRSSLYNAAWLLVGAASRILSAMEHPARKSGSRYVHVVASCYVLDNLLAVSMDRRPYFDKSYVKFAGRIEEDGLEEWQPWGGELDIATGHTSRLPILALSSFNRLIDLVDIFITGRNPGTRNDATRQLSEWKAAISPKFDYIRTVSTLIPLTPPAVLLQLTHFATMLTCEPSRIHLERCLEMLEICQEQLKSIKLPSVVICLLQCIKQSSKSLPLDQEMQVRIEKVMSNFAAAANRMTPEAYRTMPTQSNSIYTGDQRTYAGSSQVPAQAFRRGVDEAVPPRPQQRPHPSSLLEDLLPDMNPGQQLQTTNFSPISTDFTSPALDAYDPSISGDLESFFDELASLHGAKKLQNQPQFMQNLGFAPEVSMADLLATQSGQFMPTHSSTFGTEPEGEPMQFPLSDYYEAG